VSAVQQIVLVGLSGSGKSTVGRELSERLGWTLIDTDDVIKERAGKTPAELITEDGEQKFRELESAVIEEVVKRTPSVIATGGGAFIAGRNRRALGESGYICYLDATPPELARRLHQQATYQQRPLLGDDLEDGLYQLDRERRPFYNHADLWVPAQGDGTADHGFEEVADRILSAWATNAATQLRQDRRIERLAADTPAQVPAAIIDTGTERCPIWVGPGELQRLPERLQQLGLSGRIFLISDSDVMEAHGQQIADILQRAGISGASYVVPAGEASKSLRVAGELYAWLSEQRAERADVILALGGGVVGDLAGHVAATYLRGIALVQLPTSVLAMNDAAIGGKAAVDLAAGKNLVGAFHQPRAVIADTSTLSTLPRRAYLEGFGEVIKHAMILDPELLRQLERRGEALTRANPDIDALTEVTARSARLKALIVSSDPHERGLRTILNYGHTIAHAIESVTGYSEYLHGEAVSIGMAGAARISERMGLIDEETLTRQLDLQRAFGLPLQASGLARDAVLDAMLMDKKVVAGKARFILLEGIGHAVVRDDVPAELIEETIRGLVSP
jgi:shikimate kinase/3-dehydroquinate synthase